MKSLLPEAAIFAPASSAKLGNISGSGFAIANMTAFSAIVFTISCVNKPFALTPIKTSAPLIPSLRAPLKPSKFVISAIFSSEESFSFLPLYTAPNLSNIKIPSPPDFPFDKHSLILIKSLAIACPAAPAPEKTILTLSNSLPTTLRAFKSPANTTIAVPCWSSWKTGILSFSIKFCSTSKHLGALISSKFIPENESESKYTIRSISLGTCVLRQRGIALTPPKSLNSTAFPSITGSPASAPIFPKPSTALPSDTIATGFMELENIP